APCPVVTEAVLRRVHSPSVLAAGLFWPFAWYGKEFTRYPVPVPVLIAGSRPRIGVAASETGPSTASRTVGRWATSWDLEITRVIAPWKSDWLGPQYSSVETIRALLLKPVLGWSPRQFPPSEVSN